MISTIDNGTVALLSLALDAAAMRQQAIAQNIANANTPGYARVNVSFEARLAALRDADGGVAAPSLADLSNYRPVLDYLAPGASVAVDQEMAALSENVVHHHALIKAVSKHYALISSAINEGKR